MKGVIDIRKLAALDLIFHGPRFVLIEFGGAVLLATGLAVVSLRSGLSSAGHPVIWEVVFGVLLASVALNYLPLLIYSVSLVRSGTARQEVELELVQAHQSQRRYGTQQFLLLIPLAVLVLSCSQSLTRRGGR